MSSVKQQRLATSQAAAMHCMERFQPVCDKVDESFVFRSLHCSTVHM